MCIKYIIFFKCTLFFVLGPVFLESVEYYFGYGSNLNADYLRNRWVKKNIPGETIDMGCALLENYKFSYDLDLRFLGKTGTAASIFFREGEQVYGVLYQITDEQLKELDVQEFVDRAYFRNKVKVVRVEDNCCFDAWVYVGNPKHLTQNLCPEQKYVDVILEGAKQHGLPSSYVDRVLISSCSHLK